MGRDLERRPLVSRPQHHLTSIGVREKVLAVVDVINCDPDFFLLNEPLYIFTSKGV